MANDREPDGCIFVVLTLILLVLLGYGFVKASNWAKAVEQRVTALEQDANERKDQVDR